MAIRCRRPGVCVLVLYSFVFIAANEAAATDLPESSAIAIGGDPAYGEYLAGECMACHQTDGGGNGIPSIAGWAVEEFVDVMHEYRAKIRSNPVMQTVSTRLSDEEIVSLAAYFGTLDK